MDISPLYNKGIKLKENLMSQVNEIIHSSFESVYETAILRERLLISYWLNEQIKNKREPEIEEQND